MSLIPSVFLWCCSLDEVIRSVVCYISGLWAVMMELDQYLFLLATGTSLRNLQSSMEPPESPKFSLPLWQPWLASPGKGNGSFSTV